MKLDRGYRRELEQFRATGKLPGFEEALANRVKNTANNLYQRALGLTNRFTATKPTKAATTVKPTPQVKPLTMMEKLAKIDAKNAQQAVVDGLRGTGPGVRKTPKLTVTPQSLTAAKPTAQSFLRTGLRRSGIPLVAGVVDAGVDIVENKENPLVATGRAIAGTALGSLYGGSAALMADPGPTGAPSVMTAYGLGRQQGIEGFNKLMGIQPTTPTTGLPSNYKQTEDDAFLAARRARGEVASLPASAAIPGAGPEGNKVGQDYNTNKPGLQGPGDTKDQVPAASEFVGKEDEAMAIFAAENDKLATAKEKRDSTRGTSKSDNPLMKQYIKDRESRGEVLREISQQAKADTIANSPNAASINKKEEARQASVDSAIEKYSTPKADPQAFLSNAIGNLGNLNPFAAAVTSTTPTSTLAPAPDAQSTGLNIDAIGSYMTPENEDMLKNLFPGAGGLNLRTGAR